MATVHTVLMMPEIKTFLNSLACCSPHCTGTADAAKGIDCPSLSIAIFNTILPDCWEL
jgi:hypothetical protein